MKHMSKFSRFARILAMFLCVAMVAGMVGTNAAIAADEGQSVKPTFIISTPTQNVVQGYTNKGTETGFSPAFRVEATINNQVATPGNVSFEYSDFALHYFDRDFRVLFNWQETDSQTGEWIDSPIMVDNKKVGSFGDFENADYASVSSNGYNKYSWKQMSSDFKISSANGLEAARKGTQFRCVVRLYRYDSYNRKWVEIGNTISPTFKVNYLCEVNIYQGNKIAKTVNVSYGQKLVISEDVFGANSEVQLYTDARMRDRDAYDTSSAVKKGMNLYAKVTTKHAVEFVMNDHGTQVETQYIKDGQTATKPENPTDDDYNFEGWFKSDMQTPFDFGAAITADTKVYAKWSEKVQTFTVTFSHQKRHGLTDTVYSDVVDGSKITPPADPSCKTHTFVGWSSKPDMSDDFDFANTQITETTTIYSKWGVKVSFVSNIPNVTIPQQTVVYNQKVVEPTVTSNDYKVLGWYIDENFRYKYNFDTEINDSSHNFTLHAKVEKIKQVTVTFNMNGHGTAITTQTFAAGGKATKPANPTETGYDFQGWTLNGRAYDFNQAVNDNITLVANWKQKEYTVKVLARESEADKNARHGFKEFTLTVKHGETIEGKLPTNVICSYHQNDHFFVGWFTSMTLEEEFDPKTPITGDTTVYSGWSKVSEETLVTDGAKTSYTAGEELNLTNVKIVRTITRINGTSVDTLPSQEVKVTKDMVTNYQAATATATANGQTRTVNISYNGKTFTYAIAVGLNEGSVSVDDEVIEKTYGDDPFEIEAKGTGNISFESSDENVAKVVDGKIVIVGKGQAVITVTSAATSSYSEASTTVVLNVAAKEIEIQWNEDEDVFTYNGSVQKPGATVSEDDLVNGDKVTLTITTDKESKNVDSYVATATISDDNYILTNTTKEFTIAPKVIDIAWSNVGPYTYDSNPHTPKATIASTLVGDDVLTVSVNVIGSMYGVGTFIATASIDNDNYKISESTKSIECVINPEEVPAVELSFAKLVCGYTIDTISLNNTTWVVKLPTDDGVVAQKVSVVKRLLTEATAAESSDGAFVGDVKPIMLPTWPNFQQNLGSNLFVTGSGLLYKASLQEIESIVKANGTMPNSFTGTVVGGTQYVLAMTFIVNPNLKLPEQGTITATIDGKAAKVLYVKDTRVTAVSSYTVYVEFTAEHIPGEEQEENYVAPKCLEDGGVDHVVRCTACEKILSSEHETLNKTDHKWGEWIQDKDPSAKEAGHKYRKCENDPSHIDEASIDKLPAEVEKITIVIPDSAKKQYWVDEKLDVTGIEVVLSLTDGTEQKIPVTANMVTGFDSSKAADAQKLTVTYQGESANYNVAIRDVFYTVTGDLKWTRGKDMRLTVHRNFDDQLTFGKFVKLMIGGKVVDKSAFKAWSGSLELEIYNDYLDALDAGDYDLYIEFEDGSVEAKITVPERAQKEEKPEETTPEEVTPEENETKPEEKKNDTPESPKTADTAQTYVWTILLSIAVVLMLAVVVIRRRREDAE